jgi:hypothetical protein
MQPVLLHNVFALCKVRQYTNTNSGAAKQNKSNSYVHLFTYVLYKPTTVKVWGLMPFILAMSIVMLQFRLHYIIFSNTKLLDLVHCPVLKNT